MSRFPTKSKLENSSFLVPKFPYILNSDILAVFLSGKFYQKNAKTIHSSRLIHFHILVTFSDPFLVHDKLNVLFPESLFSALLKAL